MNNIADLVSGPLYRTYLMYLGAHDGHDDRIARNRKIQDATAIAARRRIYNRLAQTASGEYPYTWDGAFDTKRREAAKACLAAWPHASNSRSQATGEPIFDDQRS